MRSNLNLSMVNNSAIQNNLASSITTSPAQCLLPWANASMHAKSNLFAFGVWTQTHTHTLTYFLWFHEPSPTRKSKEVRRRWYTYINIYFPFNYVILNYVHYRYQLRLPIAIYWSQKPNNNKIVQNPPHVKCFSWWWSDGCIYFISFRMQIISLYANVLLRCCSFVWNETITSFISLSN